MQAVSGLNAKQDKALGELVRSVGSPNFPEVLGYFVGKVIGFDNMIIIAYHKDHNPEELYRECVDASVYEQMDTHYVKAAYLLDPFYEAVLAGIQVGIHRIFDLAPDQFIKTSYFFEYYRNTTLIDEFSLYARLGHDTTLTACFGRDKTSNIKFSKAELNRIKSYEATLSALCSLHWRTYQPKEGKNVVLAPVTKRLRLRLKEQHDISLSPRQAEVSLYILQGHSSLSISLNLNISKETVKVFRKQLYSKCNISSQAELFALLMPIFSML